MQELRSIRHCRALPAALQHNGAQGCRTAQAALLLHLHLKGRGWGKGQPQAQEGEGEGEVGREGRTGRCKREHAL